MYTYIPAHVHVDACTRPLHNRERAAYGPCTRTCTRPCTAVHTARVHGSVRATQSAVYTARTRPTVYTAGVHAYTAAIRPCTRPVYRPCTWYVLGRVNAVSTAHVHVYNVDGCVHGCRVHGRERAVNTARVRGRTTAVYMARTRPCTRHVHVYTCACNGRLYGPCTCI